MEQTDDTRTKEQQHNIQVFKQEDKVSFPKYILWDAHMCSVDGVTGAVEALKCRESSSKWGANTCLSHVHDKLLKWYQICPPMDPR